MTGAFTDTDTHHGTSSSKSKYINVLSCKKQDRPRIDDDNDDDDVQPAAAAAEDLCTQMPWGSCLEAKISNAQEPVLEAVVPVNAASWTVFRGDPSIQVGNTSNAMGKVHRCVRETD